MIDRDLTELNKVARENHNLTVKRNINRFQLGFMFQLTKEVFHNLILQNAISKITVSE